MREIKFQVVENNRIVAEEFSDPQFNNGAWSHFLLLEGGDAIIRDGGYSAKGLIPPIRREFTGLHDKNGKEIYEGDILRENNELWKVVWDTNKLAGFEAESIEYGGCYCLGGAGWEKAEVIGSVFENPELLEKKKS